MSELTPKQLALVLAGLRMLDAYRCGGSWSHLEGIFGEYILAEDWDLAPDEVDDLCQQINMGG